MDKQILHSDPLFKKEDFSKKKEKEIAIIVIKIVIISFPRFSLENTYANGYFKDRLQRQSKKLKRSTSYLNILHNAS